MLVSPRELRAEQCLKGHIGWLELSPESLAKRPREGERPSLSGARGPLQAEFWCICRPQKLEDLFRDAGLRQKQILGAEHKDLIAWKLREPPLELNRVAAACEI
jgi:hypothetical protein